MLRPFSSKYIASSAKYFFHGSWLPMATASNSSCVLRTSSSCVMVLPFGGVAAVAVKSPKVNRNVTTFFLTKPSSSSEIASQQNTYGLDGTKRGRSQFGGGLSTVVSTSDGRLRYKTRERAIHNPRTRRNPASTSACKLPGSAPTGSVRNKRSRVRSYETLPTESRGSLGAC